MNAEHEVLVQLVDGPQSLQELSRGSGYSKDSIYRAVDDLTQAGLLRKLRDGKRVLAALSRSKEARRLARSVIAALAHGVDPATFNRRSVVETWSHVARHRHGTVKECMKATRLSYESVRGAFHTLIDAGLAEVHGRNPLTISLGESRLNRLLEYRFLEPSGREILTLTTASFVRLYAQPDRVEDLLLLEQGPILVQGVERRIGAGKPAKVVVVMGEAVSPEAVFLKEVQSGDGVEDLCIQLLSDYPVDFGRLLRLSVAKNLVNVAGCYLDILSDIDAGLVAKREAESFRPFIAGGEPPVLLESERAYGKEGWEGRYEDRWNVDLFLDLGAIEHGVRAVS